MREEGKQIDSRELWKIQTKSKAKITNKRGQQTE